MARVLWHFIIPTKDQNKNSSLISNQNQPISSKKAKLISLFKKMTDNKKKSRSENSWKRELPNNLHKIVHQSSFPFHLFSNQ